MRQSCYDCHGGPTRLPWYGHVAPVSWLLIYDVNESMKHLDFSRWGQMPARRQQHLLEKMGDEVREGGMPLDRYLWMHAEAKMTASEREKFAAWTDAEASRMGGGAGQAAPADSGKTDDGAD